MIKFDNMRLNEKKEHASCHQTGQRRKMSFRFKRLQTTFLIITASITTYKWAGVHAFPSQPSLASVNSLIVSSGSQRISDATLLRASGWEDVVFNAESMANNWASIGLQDPSSSLITSLPIMYGAGLLTSVSPCVWGLLPLTISYISQAAGEREDRQTTLPALAFAAGLAAIFCSLGVVAAEMGGVFGASTGGNSGAIISTIAYGICLAMGFQLLDFFKLPLLNLDIPFDETKSNPEETILIDGTGQIISSSSETKANGSLFRTFLLGCSTALVASPCATPVLTSILAFVAKAQNPLLGGTLLFVYTMGYATPLLLVASTGGQALVDLKSSGGSGWYAKVAPWVSPLTGGILLWYGTNGILTSLLGDPSIAGLEVLP